MQKDIYRVIKIKSDRFVIESGNDRLICPARQHNKKGDILVGDHVLVEDGVIERVVNRKNRLIRPQIANIDQSIFIICSLPKPDFFLLDKAIVNCLKNNIEIIICVNKQDINDSQFLHGIRQQYTGRKIIAASALSSDVKEIEPLLKDKLTCLSGQSAVGKSTIINALLGADIVKTGPLSAFNRGKNTTTTTEIYKIKGGYLADTPGFSLLDFHDIQSDELELYYPEFDEIRLDCRYHRCLHIQEPDCAVKAAVEVGEINNDRYQRYLKLFVHYRLL